METPERSKQEIAVTRASTRDKLSSPGKFQPSTWHEAPKKTIQNQVQTKARLRLPRHMRKEGIIPNVRLRIKFIAAIKQRKWRGPKGTLWHFPLLSIRIMPVHCYTLPKTRWCVLLCLVLRYPEALSSKLNVQLWHLILTVETLFHKNISKQPGYYHANTVYVFAETRNVKKIQIK